MIWIPKEELEFYQEHQNKLLEKSKEIPWYEKAYYQMKFEKGNFDYLEPIIREDLRTLVYGK